MLLDQGMPAPRFHGEDVFGDSVELDDYAGRAVLLSFFRNAACALCNLRVHQLIERYGAYDRMGLAIVAVFESPREPMLDYVARQDAPFPLLADPEARLYALYGVETSAEKVAYTMTLPETQTAVQAAAALGFELTREQGSNFERMPADFLIGPDGRLLEVRYAKHISDHLPFSLIEQRLHDLAAQLGSAAPV